MSSIEGLKSAQEVAKQVITLATGVTTVSITFWDKFHTAKTPVAAATILGAGWVSLVLSIACALWVLMAITGTLTALDRKADAATKPAPAADAPAPPADSAPDPAPDAYGQNIALPALGMILTFGFGLLLCVIAAWINAVSG